MSLDMWVGIYIGVSIASILFGASAVIVAILYRRHILSSSTKTETDALHAIIRGKEGAD